MAHLAMLLTLSHPVFEHVAATLLFVQDKVASDSMEKALQAMRLRKLVRSAIKMVKGVRIRLYDDKFEMAVFSAIPWFKVCT